MTQHDTTGTSRKQADCEYAPRVSAYHDGELPERDAREVARHVAGCSACAGQLAFFGKVSGTFHAAPARHLDAGARQRLEELGEELQAERRQIKPAADVRWVRRLTAAAAILFVIAAGKVIYEQKSVRHDPGTVSPAVSPTHPVAPLRQPVSEVQSGNSQQASPAMRGGGKGPAVVVTDFVAAPRPNSENGSHSSFQTTRQSAAH